MEAEKELPVSQPLLDDVYAQRQPNSPQHHGTSSSFWRKALYPLGAYCCCQIAFQGVFTSLVLYLKRGCGFLSIITQLQLDAPVFFTISLYLAGLGYGWFKPSLAALGGDQFDTPKDRNIFYNRLFIAGTIGEVFSLTVVIYIENCGQWALGYWICTGAIGVGLLCLLGMRQVKYEAKENPFTTILHVLIAAIRKRKVHIPTNTDALYEPDKGTEWLIHTDKFRFLDKAATISEDDVDGIHTVSPWRLCSVQKVEEVKSLINILPIWAVILCKSTAISQLPSLFVEQGDAMNVMVGSFEVASASMTLFNLLARIFIAMAFDLRTRRMPTSTRSSSIAFFQIGIAYVAAILAMLIGALVETIRLSNAESGKTISILWLVPQYACEGVVLVCGAVGEEDFFYSAAAPAIRGLSSSLPQLSRGLGSYISSLLVTLVTYITTANGQAGWIASDLDDGHLNFYFLLLAIIAILAFLLYLTLIKSFSYPIVGKLE
eukprot:c18815_g1_i3 orf=303-1769(-)